MKIQEKPLPFLRNSELARIFDKQEKLIEVWEVV